MELPVESWIAESALDRVRRPVLVSYLPIPYDGRLWLLDCGFSHRRKDSTHASTYFASLWLLYCYYASKSYYIKATPALRTTCRRPYKHVSQIRYLPFPTPSRPLTPTNLPRSQLTAHPPPSTAPTSHQTSTPPLTCSAASATRKAHLSRI